MMPRRLVYLGPRTGSADAESPSLLLEGRALEPESRIALRRRRSTWSNSRPVERVIVGSHPSRADVLLEGPGVVPEHVRLYLSRRTPDVNDLRAIRDGAVWVNERPVETTEWYDLRPGDELRLGPWRFRFEIDGEG